MQDEYKLDYDSIIDKLLEVKTSQLGKNVNLHENEIKSLISKSKDIFTEQPTLLEIEAPVNVIGDIHGQYYDLLRLFELSSFPPDANYVFLGNYVDRGKYNLETISLLLCYKCRYSKNFFLLRGNHECSSINRVYGFYDECKRRYNTKLWKLFNDLFNNLPIAALINEKILCMHGGLSPELSSLEQIRNIQRPTDVPDTGLLCDLLWSDPDYLTDYYENNNVAICYTFGESAVKEFLEKHDLNLICRGHQVVQEGYEFFANRTVVTLFSAPNYCGEFDNSGALMSVDSNLKCSFKIIKPNYIKSMRIMSCMKHEGNIQEKI